MNFHPGYLTPDNVPEESHCRLFRIPNSVQWLSVWMGALYPLTDPASWQQYGALTPDEAADAALDVLWQAYSDDAQYCNQDVDAPYWESAANVAAEATPTTQPWYGGYDGETFIERLEDFALAGFIAYSGNIGGAVAFLALAPQFRLAWKSGDLGGIVRVLVDAVEIGRVDTYSATPGVVTFDVFRDPEAESQQLLLVLDDETNPDIAGDPSMSVIRKRLDPEEISNPDFRYDPDCDCVQQTGDGGATWVDSPANDVRHADAWRLPPIVADDPKCQAAANMTRFFADWLEQLSPILSAATNAWALVSILIVLFVVLGPFALIVVALDVAATLLGIGAAAIDGAFTNTVFDTLTCIFYCNIGSDGQVSAEQLASINSDIDDQIGGIAAAVLHVVLGMVGEVGLSNWGARGDAPADCDECICLACDNCTIPTAEFWTQPACVGGVGADYLEFTEEGMFSSLSLPNAQGAIADLNDFVAPGATGWVVCYQTTPGISMIEATAAESINPGDATCYLGSTTNLTLFPDNPVVVPSTQPIIFLAWAADDNGITGLCVTPA